MASYASYKRKRRKVIATISFVLAVIALIVSWFSFENEIRGFLGGGRNAQPVTEGNVEFHFIDAGQGDAAIIRTSKGVVLIDTSVNDFENGLKAYLDQFGITTIDYAVFTHPDEDHIGGADMIMKTYDVRQVILSGYTKTTKTYTNMMDAIEASEAKVTIPQPGDVFTLGELTMEALAPLEDYDDANEASVVLRVDYGATSVLFTGDAEKESEKDMVKQYSLSGKLDCDLLKAGHHGSRTSSSEDFLKAVTPEIVVISCGAENEYGHPHGETVARYEKMKTAIYRTDEMGTIVFVSDGTTLKVDDRKN